jgi:hypothetical protein
MRSLSGLLLFCFVRPSLALDYYGFTLPGEIRLCASPHKAWQKQPQATEDRLCQLDGRVGRHFRGRRGRCLADTDLTMVERLGAVRNADS